MGAVFKLHLAQSKDLQQDLLWLKEQRVSLHAAVVDRKATSLAKAAISDRDAILLGNEGQGLPGSLISLCQHRITIPMQRGMDSLNVAVAASIIIHHFIQGAD
ncbi:RNA methyltransferase [candidate division KSB1 bacterium]|nr:RNA methyltransferase [candidate division KSB1 bacterium]